MESHSITNRGYRLVTHRHSVTLGDTEAGNCKPVFDWGGFRFGVLICNELTNIRYREAFQGEVDALIVIEWNQDVEQFGTLVESAASDVHCYVIQVNNRIHGDSRLRVPAKDRWLRDAVQVRGGTEDFFVVADIDIRSLREFQSAAIPDMSTKAKFKAFPTGFRISPGRDIRKNLKEKKGEE